MVVLRTYQHMLDCCARRDFNTFRELTDPQTFRLGWAPMVDMLPLEPALMLLRHWYDAFPDFGIRHEQNSALTDGIRLAMVEFHSTFLYEGSGTLPPELGADVLPSPRNLVIEGVDIIRLDGIGRLIEWKRYYDSGALTEQLLD